MARRSGDAVDGAEPRLEPVPALVPDPASGGQFLVGEQAAGECCFDGRALVVSIVNPGDDDAGERALTEFPLARATDTRLAACAVPGADVMGTGGQPEAST
ncbi:hypothetical protein SDC9_170531 [bioreactor metagenome]|uniref:Uncharacterized protein n=1 Tax=bioreactor metagenome TaxID=1076179 RepID=A0A645GGZ0_9ZZZZ